MARVLLIVGGGIAAYKSLELVRLLRKAGHQVTPVLTKAGEHFVTAMSLGTLAESPVYSSLWELKDEVEIGHIQLSRSADFILGCPATADLLAKMAGGIADDLATTLLLATDKPVVVAPAMNVRMWLHPATRRNVQQLVDDGIRVIEPGEGEMACGEFGPGRLPEPQDIMTWLKQNGLLGGK
jgi:phosphopantothenoylcysteine decarboxylase/phosphopantothenate--cysteine ligase